MVNDLTRPIQSINHTVYLRTLCSSEDCQRREKVDWKSRPFKYKTRARSSTSSVNLSLAAVVWPPTYSFRAPSILAGCGMLACFTKLASISRSLADWRLMLYGWQKMTVTHGFLCRQTGVYFELIVIRIINLSLINTQHANKLATVVWKHKHQITYKIPNDLILARQ